MAICNNKKCSLGECDQPETCTAYVPVITNADRIRFMSDEELSKFINDSIACEHCIYDGRCDEFDNYQKCMEGVLKWLRQPVEGDLGR